MIDIAPGVRSVLDFDGAVLLDLDHDAILTLNSTGAYIWSKLQGGNTLDTIIDQLSQEASIDRQTVEHDVREFLESLKNRKLLRS